MIQSEDDAVESKVITEKTSRLLRKFLLATVEEGTANPASVKGYKVAGKTGTAEKIPRGQENIWYPLLGVCRLIIPSWWFMWLLMSQM